MATARLPEPAPPHERPSRQVDNFKTREAMDAWFATGAFDRNYVGVPFDPEYMVERQHEGVPGDEILQRDLYRRAPR